MKSVLVIALTILCSSLVAQTKVIKHNDVKRRYIVYTPNGYDSMKHYPVIFNFHGGGMTPAEQMLYTKFNQAADKYGFIAVYPKGINEDWNVGFGMSYKNGTDDIGFTEALLNQIEKDYKIAPTKVFATGLSRGGFFCHRLAAELPHRFSAVASIGASLPDSVAYYNKSESDVSVLIVHGTADKVVNYNGKEGGYASALNTYKYWKKDKFTNESSSTINKIKHDSTHVKILQSSFGKKSVVLVSIENGGHTWPGADDFNVGLPIGLTTKEIDINDYMWKFFNGQK